MKLRRYSIYENMNENKWFLVLKLKFFFNFSFNIQYKIHLKRNLY